MNPRLEFFCDIRRTKTLRVDFHRHKCHELVYYANGVGGTHIGGKTYEYAPGTFALIEPGVSHAEDHYENTHVLFIGFKFDSAMIKIENHLYPDAQGTILGYMQQIKKELADKKPHFEVKADLLIAELLIELSRMREYSPQKGDSFAYIIKYMEENFNQPVDLESLAGLSGYSYHHFRHLFKEKTGFSPVHYVIKQRLQNACNLLETTGQSITEISQESGFYNTAQFSSMFKEHFGVSPTSYRKAKLGREYSS